MLCSDGGSAFLNNSAFSTDSAYLSVVMLCADSSSCCELTVGLDVSITLLLGMILCACLR